jgi:hypothetical protein
VGEAEYHLNDEDNGERTNPAYWLYPSLILGKTPVLV